ncbi:hypothetical protein IMZ48_10675 [Candidatus Bathyarchaeota archaeon]|nr:hypothetical protein [Candidatus Bathyarchaeota archaeon]
MGRTTQFSLTPQSWIIPQKGALYQHSSVLTPSALIVYTTMSRDPSLPSPPA